MGRGGRRIGELGRDNGTGRWGLWIGMGRGRGMAGKGAGMGRPDAGTAGQDPVTLERNHRVMGSPRPLGAGTRTPPPPPPTPTPSGPLAHLLFEKVTSLRHSRAVGCTHRHNVCDASASLVILSVQCVVICGCIRSGVLMCPPELRGWFRMRL